MRILVKYFAILKEKTGIPQEEYQLNDSLTVKELKEYLKEVHPEIRENLNNIITSINLNFAFDDESIPDQAEIGFFPPVSGGSGGKTIIRIVGSDFSVDEMIREITHSTTGAVCIFTGIVREKTEGENLNKVSYIDYETYEEMAEKKLDQVAEEIREKWPDIESVVLMQKIGRVKPGNISTIVACSGIHRNDGIFDAAKYGIDRIKEIVPVWKKEVDVDRAEWKEGKYFPEKGD